METSIVDRVAEEVKALARLSQLRGIWGYF
jgi:hypothetical protein